jgi:hypothetical protein
VGGWTRGRRRSGGGLCIKLIGERASETEGDRKEGNSRARGGRDQAHDEVPPAEMLGLETRKKEWGRRAGLWCVVD